VNVLGSDGKLAIKWAESWACSCFPEREPTRRSQARWV